jgi:hypothetical protein
MLLQAVTDYFRLADVSKRRVGNWVVTTEDVDPGFFEFLAC